ncbi:MAG: FAD-dependent oxidoreductase [Planctomycetia bacterium]|nr:FAD-dependent oxidoreductase [Planctomycetia bacterium]
MISRRQWMLTAGTLAAGALNAESGVASEAAVSEKEISFTRTLPIRYDVDVFIAGGGPAGTAAAVAARSRGARVFLAEAHSCFGGMGTAGRVPVFMQMSDGEHFLCGGYGKTVVDTLKKDRLFPGPATDIESLKRVYDLLVKESGTDFTFYTTFCETVVSGGHIDAVICVAPTGMFAVRAKVYIDATGNGDLAVRAGAKFEKGDAEGHMMPGSLCSLWSGIDWAKWNAARPKGIPQPQGYKLKQAIQDGVFSVPDEHFTGVAELGGNLGGANIGHVFGVDGTDERSITDALLCGRRSMKEFTRYFNEYLEGFEEAKMVDTGSLLGIRETRRILGDYVLSLDDYKKRAVFPDEIGRYAYPIDIHPLSPNAVNLERHRKEFDQEFRYAKGESYGIPYRTLTPVGWDNLLTAGRCISSDHYVHGSVRVMPGCFITGQASGMAAALAVESKQSVHDIDVKKLQTCLKDFGAYLPNA